MCKYANTCVEFHISRKLLWTFRVSKIENLNPQPEILNCLRFAIPFVKHKKTGSRYVEGWPNKDQHFRKTQEGWPNTYHTYTIFRITREGWPFVNQNERLACTRAKSKKQNTVKTMLFECQLCSRLHDMLVSESRFRKTYTICRITREGWPFVNQNERIACTRAKSKKTNTVKTMLLECQLCSRLHDMLVSESRFRKTQEGELKSQKISVPRRATRSPLPKKLWNIRGIVLWLDPNHAGGESPAHCLRFAIPPRPLGVWS